jgi:hypothetical protein
VEELRRTVELLRRAATTLCSLFFGRKRAEELRKRTAEALRSLAEALRRAD